MVALVALVGDFPPIPGHVAGLENGGRGFHHRPAEVYHKALVLLGQGPEKVNNQSFNGHEATSLEKYAAKRQNADDTGIDGKGPELALLY